MNVERVEQVIAIAGGALVTVGVALIYPPAALIVAGCFLIASVIELPRRRPKT
jgi:uncharacterized membrane protein